MIEGRWIIGNTKEIRKKILNLGGKYKDSYEFTDKIFFLAGQKDLKKSFIRIRNYKLNNWNCKRIVIIQKETVWNAGYKKDIIKIKKEFDNIQDAMTFLNPKFKKLGKSFKYKRKGYEFTIANNHLFIEDIKNFKPTIEIETNNKKELKKLVKNLKLKRKINDSIPEVMRKILI